MAFDFNGLSTPKSNQNTSKKENEGSLESLSLKEDIKEKTTDSLEDKNKSLNSQETILETKETLDNSKDILNKNETLDRLEKNTEEKKENKINEKDFPISKTNNTNTIFQDTVIRMEIDKVLMGDGLDEIYESLNEKEKEKFNEAKEKANIKIIEALKILSKNIKKAAKLILKAIAKFINSIKGINNTAYKEKMIKIKVEKILQEQSEKENLTDFKE